MDDIGTGHVELDHGGISAMSSRMSRTASAVIRAALLCLGVFAAANGPARAADPVYDYPIDDPFAATVVGTPTSQQAPLNVPSSIGENYLDARPDRDYPDIFWYTRKMRYLVALQDHPAPLAFVISGTGSNHKSISTVALAFALFDQGAHVVTLPSPTHPNFIVAASRYSRPGSTDDDVSDLLDVMTQIRDELVDDGARIDGYLITGYSMGAFHAAVVAEADSRLHRFDFDKVMLVNPPVSLYESAKRLDAMLLEGIPGGMLHFNEFYSKFMQGFADVYVEARDIDLTGDFLYDIYKEREIKGEDIDFKALIGLSFRLSAANLIFTTDVMNRADYVVPANVELGTSTSLTDYFKVCAQLDFNDYITELFLPLVKKQKPPGILEQLVDKASLRSIEPYLRNSPNVALMTNADDVILGDGDIQWFEDVFGDRAKIWPNGGHLGNLRHHSFIDYFKGFFTIGGEGK
ncbi:MAG: alpha/beta hydrolase [Geminicoccaceae bacterium]|nr:alpha/beta hydrolase [Geminicoccaceae bacterium]